MLDRKTYEENLRQIQKQHLDSIHNRQDAMWRPCMHDQCGNCHGTGVDSMGRPCVHAISCPGWREEGRVSASM